MQKIRCEKCGQKIGIIRNGKRIYYQEVDFFEIGGIIIPVRVKHKCKIW